MIAKVLFDKIYENKNQKFCYYVNGKMAVSSSHNMICQLTNYYTYQKENFNLQKGDIVMSVFRNNSFHNLLFEIACLLNSYVHCPVLVSDGKASIQNKAKIVNPKIIVFDSLSLFKYFKSNILLDTQIRFIEKDFTTNEVLKLDLNNKKKVEDALILFSSGTNQQKGIILSQNNLFYSYTEFSNSDIFENTSTYLELLDFSFSGGKKVMYSALINGNNICFRIKTQSVVDNILIYKPDITACVPSMLEEIYNYISIHGNDLSIKKIICGGAVLNAELQEYFLKFGITVYNVYGLTETTSLCSYSTTKDFRIGSVGKFTKSIKYKLNKNNELLVKGDVVSRKQIINGNIINPLDKEGYYNTMDIVSIDEDGYLYIKGRSSSFIKNNKGSFLNLEDLASKISGLMNSRNCFVFTEEDGVFLTIPNLNMIDERLDDIIEVCRDFKNKGVNIGYIVIYNSEVLKSNQKIGKNLVIKNCVKKVYL